MSRQTRFRTELALAIASGALFVLTLITREWVEMIFRVKPDGGSGAFEWALAVGLLVLTVVFSVLARADYKRLQPASA